MPRRFDYRKANPEAFQAMIKFDQFASQVDIEPALRELIKIRVSQWKWMRIRIDSHSKDARVAR